MPSWAFGILLVIVLQLGLTTVLSLWEKRLLWPYAPMDERLDPTPYMVTAAGLAQAMGLQRIGLFRDGKGRIYRVRYEFWLPPERDALVLIGGGRIAAMPIDATWIFTRLGDGRYLVTVDNAKASEYDLTGLRAEALYPAAGLRVLLDRHRQRVAAAAGLALPFSAQDPMADHRDLIGRRVELLVQRGYAQFVDRNRGVWRYTARGAMRLALGLNWTLLRRSITRQAT